MVSSWIIIAVALAYVGALFAIASYGDRLARARPHPAPRPFIYALSLCIYCTSWTFFGSVGLASRSGLDFLPIYIGPIVMLAAGWPLLRIIVEVSKKQNITSIADFISARYGKNQALGALVALFAVIGTVPYISLQLKAVSFSLDTLIPDLAAATSVISGSAAHDLALLVTIAMAAFAILFGTRHIDATEHQDGMILAIAVESVVKLVAFLAVGAFATFWLMGGLDNLIERASQNAQIAGLFAGGFEGGRWVTMTLLSMFAIILLPRQFHVAVVENTHVDDVRRAAWLFPLYLVAINLFVVPIAIAGLLTFADGGRDGDTFVLALPFEAGNSIMTLIAFIGGLSAATAMVIIEAVALSIMVCNNLVVPVLLRRHDETGRASGDMGPMLIAIRRIAIAVILGLAFGYFRATGNSAALAQTGLMSFVAVAQLAPAFFGGILWRSGTARGAMAGLTVGIAVWAYTMVLPTFVEAGWMSREIITDGPFGLALLRPQILFNLRFDPLTHAFLWSLGANLIVYVVVSLTRRPNVSERVQAARFVTHDLPSPGPSLRLWRTSVTTGDLIDAVARYVGMERAERSFAEFTGTPASAIDRGAEADIDMLHCAEHLLASAVGAASARLVLALLLKRHARNPRGAMRLLDDASSAIQYNRDLLQSAIDHVRQGIAVFDAANCLVCWNRQFRALLDLPEEFGQVGTPLEDVLEKVARSAGVGDDEIAAHVVDRITRLTVAMTPYQEKLGEGDLELEVRSSRMPDGGVVVTFADITERVRAAQALEQRVAERTGELVALNAELERAKAEAERANLDKTRFIAAASHDILQPLNAARLFTSTLVERQGRGGDDDTAANIDASLEAVEEILTTVLDISRLDTGAMSVETSTFRLDELLSSLARAFAPEAQRKGVRLDVVGCSAIVRTDRRLLRRVLQNLLSNALKYAPRGRVVMGCRRQGGHVRIEVHDSGDGIPADKIKAIFSEFTRLDNVGRESGLGLGLSIVERISNLLGLDLKVVSEPGRGTTFSLKVAVAGADDVVPPVRVRSRPPVVSRALEGRRVLVIDNEPAILEGTCTLLTGWGLEVRTAASRGEARKHVRSPGWRTDVALIDYHLDNDNGLDVLASLRTGPGGYFPAILITADRSREVKAAAAAAGAIYLSKPVRPAALRAALSRALSQAEAAE